LQALRSGFDAASDLESGAVSFSTVIRQPLLKVAAVPHSIADVVTMQL
jgi:hypothetical protein